MFYKCIIEQKYLYYVCLFIEMVIILEKNQTVAGGKVTAPNYLIVTTLHLLLSVFSYRYKVHLNCIRVFFCEIF